MQFHTINPSTGNILFGYSYSDWSELDRLIALSFEAYGAWSTLTLLERISDILRLKDVLEQHLPDLAESMTTEMGKPLAESEAEIKKSITLIDYFCKQSPEFLKQQVYDFSPNKSYVCFLPMGPILGIMPWNFPLWQIIRFAIPTLLLGNTVIIKHAENVTGSAMLIEKIFSKVLRSGVYLNAVADLDNTGKIIDDFRVRGVSLTGSVRAGREVAARAGRALKKVVLELGGSDPYLILDDADLERAAAEVFQGRMLNSGQSCIAAKRVIVTEKNFEHFEKLILQHVRSLNMGDPRDRRYNLGPIARADLRYQLHDQVMRTVSKGGKLLYGGTVPSGHGFFYPPTVLTEVKPGMPAFNEEVFGPVVALIRAQDESHAIGLANASEFGLGGAVFSKNLLKAEAIASQKIQSGVVFVNEFVKSNPVLPFGGIKNSGVGREMGYWGMLEFANIKTVWVKK